MIREEVKVELATGLAHDHLASSTTTNRRHHNHNHHQRQHQHHKQHHHNKHNTPTNYPHHQPFGCLSSLQDNSNIITTSSVLEQQQQQTDLSNPTQDEKQQTPAISTIAILRRHPMFDSLVLVKKYRACLQGHTLEFPRTSKQKVGGDNDDHDDNSIDKHSIVPQIFSQSVSENEDSKQEGAAGDCNKTKLVSVYLDGDDPIFQSQAAAATMRKTANERQTSSDIVYVPINGLLDRLENYNRHGISIDSRVYAFAMGLKTAERFLTSSSEKEIQEAPPL